MEIQFFRPEGPQPTEMAGLDEFRRALPRSWKGFANFVMRQPTRRGQDRELDVVIVAPDRLVIVDLKHVRGRIENRGGFWFRGEDNLGSSPAHKIRDNAKILASLIRSEVPQLPTVPPVESVVVLTNPLADPSGLDPVERDRTIKLVDFVRIANEAQFRALFTTHSRVDASHPLTAAPAVTALQKFFRNGRLFEPRTTQFHGFVPTGDPEFAHRLYVEYPCHQAADPNYTGLLRLWDFSAEPDFLVEEERRPIADRERAVLGHIRIQDPALNQNYVLQSVRHDSEYTLRYSEVFDRLPDLERLTRFSAVLADLTLERRVEFAALFLDRVASLHRIRIAHRDLDRHSVWIDERRSKVVLSSFGAAHFPERKSIGDTRSKLMASGLRAPEDVGESARGTPFQQDVFFCGALIWNLLTGQRLESIDKVPIWDTDTFGKAAEVPAVFASWFDKCLHLEANARFTDAIEAADAFARLVRQTEKVSLEKQLERYRQDVDPISDFPPIDWITQKPYRVYRARRNDTDFFVKSWPERSLGERRKTAARQIEFLGKADTLRISAADWLPKIELACLCTDGLLLVEEWIDGLTLEKCNIAEWSSVDLRDFVRDLVGAVDDLHELGLVHGDLSPSNIMMRNGEARPRPVLVDAVDFSEADKRWILQEAARPAASAAEVARRYGIDQRLLRRWKNELTEATPSFVTVQITDAAAPTTDEEALS